MFRLVVLRQDLELLHGGLRKRGPAARVLPDNAAVEDVILVAHAVDEDVDLGGVEAAGGDLFARLVVGHASARREGREVQKVALVLREVPDLFRGHAGRDFGGARLDQPRIAHHLDRLRVDDVGVDLEIDRDGLSGQNLNGPGLRLVLIHRHGDVVTGRPQSRQVESALTVADGFVREAALNVSGRNVGAGQGPGRVDDRALNGRRGALGRDRRRRSRGDDEECQ